MKLLSGLNQIKYKLLAGITLVIVVSDQWTKHLVHTRFRLGESLTLIQSFFDFTYVRNRGAAFGLCNNCPPVFRDTFFLVIPFVALIVIFLLLMRVNNKQKWVIVGLSLIVGGAIGNLIDRIRFRYVIDFIDVHWKEVYHWPAFNVADSCIVVGVSIMFIHSFFPKWFGDEEASGVKLEKKPSGGLSGT